MAYSSVKAMLNVSRQNNQPLWDVILQSDLLESGLVDYIISTSAKGRDPSRDSVKFRRKATELSIPCITAIDTARVLVDTLRSGHDLDTLELVDISTLHRKR